jgi:hypothetical protein
VLITALWCLAALIVLVWMTLTVRDMRRAR